MNGDLNNSGDNLIKSFVEISKMAGFKNIEYIRNGTNTNKYIAEDTNGLTNEEQILLTMFDPEIGKLDFR
jgi:hypothetical protein